MSYFRELPVIQYQSPFSTRSSSNEYVNVKNLFRRVKLRDDLKSNITFLRNYYVRDGFRPDQVANDLYGSSTYDWVVIHTGGIVNIRDEWPLTSKEIYDYSFNKYGNDLNQIKYYVTTEVKDASNNIIVPAGKIVPSNFQVSYYNGSTTVTANPVVSVTNAQYETELNSKKQQIQVIKPELVEDFVATYNSLLKKGKITTVGGGTSDINM